jgi:hypothetical protein
LRDIDVCYSRLAGTKALDAAYGEAKKAKQQLDGKGVAKTRRAANMRRRKRSAGDHNHEGPGAENPEPGDTKPVSEAAPMINWDRSASLFGMPLGRPGPPGFSSQIPL